MKKLIAAICLLSVFSLNGCIIDRHGHSDRHHDDSHWNETHHADDHRP